MAEVVSVTAKTKATRPDGLIETPAPPVVNPRLTPFQQRQAKAQALQKRQLAALQKAREVAQQGVATGVAGERQIKETQEDALAAGQRRAGQAFALGARGPGRVGGAAGRGLAQQAVDQEATLRSGFTQQLIAQQAATQAARESAVTAEDTALDREAELGNIATEELDAVGELGASFDDITDMEARLAALDTLGASLTTEAAFARLESLRDRVRRDVL